GEGIFLRDILSHRKTLHIHVQRPTGLQACANAAGSSEAKTRSRKQEARQGSVGFPEARLAVDPDRLPALAAAPVEAVAMAMSFLRATHGHGIPGLQGFLRRHPAVAVPVHV